MDRAKKEKEMAEFRKRKILCTEDTLRRMKSDEELQKDAKYRERLYDWVKSGCYGLKPLNRREINAVRQRETNIELGVSNQQTNSQTA